MKPVVLLVEDNPGDALLVQSALSEAGFDATLLCVENAVLAFRYLLRRAPFENSPRPDLVVLDLALPVLSGHDLLREIRATARWREIPVVVLSSSRRPEDIRASLDLGALAYLPKPVEWHGYVDVARTIERHWRALSGAA